MNLMARLVRINAKPEKTIIGLMSGMSMDGINIACARIGGAFPDLQINLVAADSRSYSRELQERLRAGQTATAAEVARLNFAVAQVFADSVTEFLAGHDLRADQIDAIGSHGQTLFHSTAGGAEALTLQVGDPSIIAQRTGILAVGNFRIRDIAAGGQGAPLVSLADFLHYRRPGKTVALNNLGSISNVTIVPDDIEGILAFDTGPANMPIDFMARRLAGNSDGIDRDGHLSAQGKVLTPLLTAMLALPYFGKPPPKAAGYDEFGPAVLQRLLAAHPGASGLDLLRTSVEFSARTLADSYTRFVLPRYPELRVVKFSGGGIYNKTLMRRIAELLPQLQVECLSATDSDAKEALSFAILAHETLCGRAGNVTGATGAQKRVVLGEIAL
jgi:anhydro-N-acetylmuramic acid kinase